MPQVKTCAWGACKSDTRHNGEDWMDGVTFIPFPKLKTQLERCMEWIRLCNRPHYQLNVSRIKSHHFVCSKHFKDGSTDYPEPAGDARRVKKRKTPTERSSANETGKTSRMTPPTASSTTSVDPNSSIYPTPTTTTSITTTSTTTTTSKTSRMTPPTTSSTTSVDPNSSIYPTPTTTTSTTTTSTTTTTSKTLTMTPTASSSSSVDPYASIPWTSSSKPLRKIATATPCLKELFTMPLDKVISTSCIPFHCMSKEPSTPSHLPNFSSLLLPMNDDMHITNLPKSSSPIVTCIHTNTDSCKTSEKLSQSTPSSNMPNFSQFCQSPNKCHTENVQETKKGLATPTKRSSIPDIKSLLTTPKKQEPKVSTPLTCKSCSSNVQLSVIELKRLIRNEYVNNVLLNDANCFHYTGFPSVGLLLDTFDWLMPCIINMTRGRGKENRKILDYKAEFILTLIKIRRGLDNKTLGDSFKISRSTVSDIFTKWVPLLDRCFSDFINWPSKEICQINTPSSFKQYPNTRAIIDCTEYTIERPFMPGAQRITYSNYKHRNTAKQLIAIMPTGYISFISKLYCGSISDVAIVRKSGFLDYVEAGDNIMADRGFNIRHLLLQKRATLNIPAYSRGKALSHKAVVRSRKIAAVRIHVERAIRRIKTFRILNNTISLRMRRSLDSITRIVAFLCNLQPCLVEP